MLLKYKKTYAALSAFWIFYMHGQDDRGQLVDLEILREEHLPLCLLLFEAFETKRSRNVVLSAKVALSGLAEKFPASAVGHC